MTPSVPPRSGATAFPTTAVRHAIPRADPSCFAPPAAGDETAHVGPAVESTEKPKYQALDEQMMASRRRVVRRVRTLPRRGYRRLLEVCEAFVAGSGSFRGRDRAVSSMTSLGVLLAVAIIVTLGLAVIILL